MARRITKERVKKWGIATSAVGVPLSVLLIWFMLSLGVIDVTGFSGDVVCDGTELDPCYAFINFTVNEDVFIYPDEGWSVTAFSTDTQPKSVQMYRSWGSGWREIKLDQPCTGTWCGLSNSKDERKFSFAFREGRDYQIRYKVLKYSPQESIKWSFGPVDPIFYGVNNSYKVYDEEERKFEIKDKTFNTTIYSGKLLSEQNFRVAPGYQKFAEFEVNSSVELTKLIDGIELIDKKTNQKINRQIDIKYKTYENVTINDYETICDVTKLPNETEISECEQFVIGNHSEQKIIWEDLNDSNFKGYKVIGLFTNIEIGDHIEWIPTFSGVKINEWASWNADMNVGLIEYWAFEEGGGTNVNGSLGGINYSCGDIVFATGKVGDAVFFDGTGNCGSATTPEVGSYTGWTWSGWINVSNTDRMDTWIMPGGAASIQIRVNAGKALFYVWDDAVSVTSTLPSYDVWHHTVLQVVEGGAVRLWVNGVNVDNDTTGAFRTSGTTSCFGYQCTTNDFEGSIDEMGIWNRTLTDEEIVDVLWNGGDGNTYTDVFTPTITLNSPVDTFNSTSLTIDFNGTATSLNGVTNVTLFIDGILNETNSSGINASDYLFTKTLANSGSHNWTYESCNVDGCTTATTRTFTILLNITGTIKDGDSNNLDNASVFIVNQSDNSLSGNTTSNASGFWTFGPVLTGTYIITGYDPSNSTLDGDAEPHVVVP